jgi:hypothetical protein
VTSRTSLLVLAAAPSLLASPAALAGRPQGLIGSLHETCMSRERITP